MGASFLLRGAASVKAAIRDHQEAEKRQAQFNKTWRFLLQPQSSTDIIFVDGALGEDGHLVPVRAYEHHLELNHKWGNYYVCPREQQPELGYVCPIHEGADDPSAPKGSKYAFLNSFLTVIDTSIYTNPKTGNSKMNGRRLFMMNPTSFELIDAYAGKRGGLVGWKVSVKRTSKNASGIGDMFDFIEKKSAEEWGKLYQEPKRDDKGLPLKDKAGNVLKQSMFQPLSYDDEIGFGPKVDLSAYEGKLRGLGFGKGAVAGNTGFQTQGPGETADESEPGMVQNYEEVL